MSATESTFAERVDWTTAWTIAFMSTFDDGAGYGTFGDGAGYGTGGAWGSGIVHASAERAGAEEAMGEFCSHEGRGELSCWAVCDVMLVVRGKLRRSYIHWISVCSFRSPWTAASPSARGAVGW